MYARSYGVEENPQDYTKGENIIPANYSGNAFLPDPPEKPDEATTETPCPIPNTDTKKDEPHRSGGLFSGILSRFDKGFELDDLLIIGLILLLLNGDKSGCAENRDEVIIILALLLLGG